MSTQRKDLRGTWLQAGASLFLSVLLILTVRWALFEPYVIPSGSMIPSLLIHDHILVNKFSYGVRAPFTNFWLLKFAPPKRGDVVVFKSVDQQDIFVVKRVIGLAGDEIMVEPDGTLMINGKPAPKTLLTKEEVESLIKNWPDQVKANSLQRSEFAIEDLEGRTHYVIRERTSGEQEQGPFKVPADSLFMMGDNRDNSVDSRSWGALPLDHILGRASVIWLSCEETLPEANQICDPNTIRWDRMFEGIR